MVNRYEDVKVLGYTENISKYMRWADLVITKAGGITLFEILHSQVPLFVIHPFLEQEMNNARYAAEYRSSEADSCKTRGLYSGTGKSF